MRRDGRDPADYPLTEEIIPSFGPWMNAFGCASMALMVGLLALALVSMFNEPPTPTDPRKGHVPVDTWTVKYCDGRTLIYDGPHSMSVAPKSPECAR